MTKLPLSKSDLFHELMSLLSGETALHCVKAMTEAANLLPINSPRMKGTFLLRTIDVIDSGLGDALVAMANGAPPHRDAEPDPKNEFAALCILLALRSGSDSLMEAFVKAQRFHVLLRSEPHPLLSTLIQKIESVPA